MFAVFYAGLILQLCVQATAAWLALCEARTSKNRGWWHISIALTLMLVRRATALSTCSCDINVAMMVDTLVLPLMISCGFLVGMIHWRPTKRCSRYG